MRKLLTILLFLYAGNILAQTTVDTTIAGWNAVIYRPAKYYTNGNADSSLHCIVFSYGAGETAASYSTMRSIGGPIPYLLAGGPDSVTISGVVKKFIAIGLRIPLAFPTNGEPLVKLDSIRSWFKIKKQNLHVSGFSAGGYAYKIMATEDAADATPPYGPFTYADAFKSIVDIMGVVPDDNSLWYDKVKNFARNNVGGGKFLGFWGTLDSDRQIPRLVDSMNAAVSGSATVIANADAHAYDPGVHRILGYPNGTAPQNFTINGISQNAYQWMIRTGDTTSGLVSLSVSITNSTGNITLPTSTVSLTANATGGTSPYTYVWSKVKNTGNSLYTIASPTSSATTITGLWEGTYTFKVVVTDNVSAKDSSTITFTVSKPVCNVSAPAVFTRGTTATGEIYILNASGQGWKGGDTVKIPAGNYTGGITLGQFIGDSCKPIIITNSGGQVVTEFIRLNNQARYFKIMGNGTPSVTYGFLTKSAAFTSVRDFEMQYVHMANNSGGVGIYCKANPDSTKEETIYPYYEMANIKFLNNKITNVEGEGMYIGDTAPYGDPYYNNLIPLRMRNVEVAYNIVDSCGWDGIQLSAALSGNSIHHNTISNIGRLDLDAQRAGIIMGGYSKGNVYNNTLTNVKGNGIQIFGYDTILVYNNVLNNVGTTATNVNGEQSVYCRAGTSTVETFMTKAYYKVYDNYIKNPKLRGAITIASGAMVTDSVKSDITNNRLCIPGAGVGWEATYLQRQWGSGTTTANYLQCDILNGIRLRKRIKQ